MNHRPECNDIWQWASLGLGDSSLSKWSPWGHRRPRPRGTYSKNL